MNGTSRQPAGIGMQDDAASTHVLEAVMVAILIVTSVAFVVTFEVPTTSMEAERTETQTLLRDAIAALAARDSESEPEVYGSQLEQYVMEALSGDNTNLQAYLDALLPAGSKYNLVLHNGYAAWPLIDKGSPPEEAIGATLLFSPKLTYSFVQPELEYHHGDFAMDVYQVPVKNSLIVQDEGFPLRLNATFIDDDADPDTEDEFQVSGYTTGALVDNSGETYPQVSMYIEGPSGQEALFVERTWGTEEIIDGNVNFEVTFKIVLSEGADVEVPKNARMSIQIPRGWDISSQMQEDIRDDPDLGNVGQWRSIGFEGDLYTGWTVTAEVAQEFVDEKIYFTFPAVYRMVIDTAHNYFTQFEAWLDHGAHGRVEWYTYVPNINAAGAFDRTVVGTNPKPWVTGSEGVAGFVFVNAGNQVELKRVDLVAETGMPVFGDADDLGGTAGWSMISPTHIRWEPDDPVLVNAGGFAQSLASVTGAASGPSEYRNADYVRTETIHDPTYLLQGSNSLNPYTHVKNHYRQSGPYIFKATVDPNDDLPGEGPLVTGWPDETGNRYYFYDHGYVDYTKMKGRGEFRVLPLGSTAQLYSSYQGPIQHATVELDNDGEPSRSYELGDSVTIRNNFSALFTALGQAEALSPGLLTDSLVLVSKVYGPAGAYAHVPLHESREFAGDLSGLAGSLAKVMPLDVNDDGVMDAIVAGAERGLYAIDGNDGAKFWAYLPDGKIVDFAFGDFDRDGSIEIAAGDDEGILHVVEPAPWLSSSQRVAWTVQVNATVAEPVTVVAARGDLSGNEADDIVVGTGSGSAGGVYVFDHFDSDRRVWDYPLSLLEGNPTVSTLNIVEERTASGDRYHVVVGDRSFYVRSLNGTTGEVEWKIKFGGEIVGSALANINDDQWDDVIVGTNDGWILALNGRKGTDDYDTVVSNPLASYRDVLMLDEGTFYAATNSIYGLFMTQDNLYSPPYVRPSVGPVWKNLDFIAKNQGWVVNDLGEVWYTETNALSNASYSLRGTLPGVTALDPPVRIRFADAANGVVLTEKGRVFRSSNGGTTWTEVQQLCHDASNPCGLDIRVRDLDKATGPSGVTYFAAARVEDSLDLVNPDRGGALWKMGPTDATFQLVRYDASREIHGVDFLDPQTGFIVGQDGYIRKTVNGGASWTTHNLPGGDSVFLRGVSMADADHGFIVGDEANLYKLIDGGTKWTGTRPELPEGGLLFDFRSVSAYNANHAWAGGTTGILVGTNSFDWQDHLYTVDLGTGKTPPPAQQATLHWDTRERHRATIQGEVENTAIDWYYSVGQPDDWAPLPKTATEDQNEDGLLYTATATVDCAVEDCSKVWIKGRFQTLIDASGNENDVLGPELGKLVRMGWTWAGAPGESDVDWHNDQEASSPIWDASRSDTLATPLDDVGMDSVEKFWAYRYGKSTTQMHLDASVDFTGDGTPDVAVGDRVDSTVLVLDGKRGILLTQKNLLRGVAALAAADFSSTGGEKKIVATYATGDTLAPFDLATVMDYTTGALKHYEVSAGSDSAGGGIAVADDLDLNGQREFFVSSPGGSIWRLDLVPKDLWSSQPAGATGKVTFEYPVPLKSLYGTHFVVSELEFELQEVGVPTPVGQVARVVDWFNVQPPGKQVPEPPFYDLEVIVWFDER